MSEPKTPVTAVNWTRGFLRLWLAIAVLWAVAVSLAIEPWKHLRIYNEASVTLSRAEKAGENARLAEEAATETEKPSIREDRKKLAIISAKNRIAMSDAKQAWVSFGLLLVLPIALLLVTGIGLRWVLRGFRS